MTGTDNQQEVHYDIPHGAEPDSSPHTHTHTHSTGLHFRHDPVDPAGDPESRDQVDYYYYTTVLREGLSDSTGEVKTTEVLVLLGAALIALTLILIGVCTCAVCLMLRPSEAPPSEQLKRDENATIRRHTFVTPGW